MVNKGLVNGDLDAALKVGNIAALNCYQFIKTDDLHYKYTIDCLLRSYKISKKCKNFDANYKKQFKVIIQKVKKGNLTKEDLIEPQMPEELKEEVEKYGKQDLYDWVENWTPESVAFKYLNGL